MQVTPNVRIVPVPEDDPMRPQQTNIFIVGRGEVLSIDSGLAIDKFKWMLRGYLAAIERSEIAIAGITHHHFDHSGNLKEMREALKAEVAIPEHAEPLLKGRLPKDGVRTLRGGHTISLDGGVKVDVIATPGHSVDSICYYLEAEGVLFTGDTLLGYGTTVVGELAPYRESLRTLVALPNLKVICPGHGPLVHDPRERLQSYIDHRDMREEQILGVLARGEPVTSWQIMLELYPEIDKRLRRAADGNVRAHLAELEKAGRLQVEPGKRRRPNKEKVFAARVEARERRAVIRQAKRYEEAERKRTVAMQESPPTEQWARMPSYALKPAEDDAGEG